MNEKIIFQHLPKCGGSTFSKIIYRMYKPENTFSIHTVNNIRLNLDEFKGLPLVKRDKINLLYGHIKFGMHNYMTGNPSYFTFLRKPVERIISYYNYVLSLPEHRLYNQLTKEKMTLYDFVTKINQGDVNNGQIMFISGVEDKEDIMLEKALENIEKHYSFVGTVEKFDESLVLLKKMYNWSIPYYKIVNKAERGVSINTINKTTIDTINDLNKGDNILYNKINSTLNKMIEEEQYLEWELFKLNIYNRLYSNNTLRKIGRQMKKLGYIKQSV